MILVTDEDRDSFATSLTYEATLATLVDNDWSLHAILNQALIPDEAVGTKLNSNGTYTYYVPGPETGDVSYAEGLSTTSTIGAGDGTTEMDYVPLAFATDGAVWNLNKLRSGGFIADVFALAFVDITVRIIVDSTSQCVYIFFGIDVSFIVCFLIDAWDWFLGLFGL